MHVGQLFHFQGALQASGKVETPTNKEICWVKNTTQTHLPMINKLLFSYNSFAISRTFESRVKTLLNTSDIIDLIRLVCLSVSIPDHIWQLLETLDDLGPPGLEADPVLGHDQGEHGEGEHLAGVGLGRGNSNLRAGVDVDPTVRLTTDGGANLEVFS